MRRRRGHRPDTYPRCRRDRGSEVLTAFDLGLRIGADEEANRWRRQLRGLVDAIDEGTVEEYYQQMAAAQLADDVEQWLSDQEGQS